MLGDSWQRFDTNAASLVLLGRNLMVVGYTQAEREVARSYAEGLGEKCT
jgi:hypothetical protein